MQRPWRRALWGYRTKSAEAYVQFLENQIAERCTERDAALSQLEEQIRIAELEVADAETALNGLQAEYFVLCGELNELSMRSQRTLQEAHVAWTRNEDEAHNAVEEGQAVANNLAQTILTAPEEIQRVIQRITAMLSPTAAGKKDAPNTLVNPGLESTSLDMKSVGYPDV